jgi:hypothetical protein
MLPPIGERRLDTLDEEPSGNDDASSPPAATPDPAPEARRRPPRTRDLVALYAVRAEANGIDLRPLIDERRERRPTEAPPIVAIFPTTTPTPVGRGTAEHRDAVRRARAIAATSGPSHASAGRSNARQVWRRWRPTAGLAKLAMLIGGATPDGMEPSKRPGPRARRVVQGRA